MLGIFAAKAAKKETFPRKGDDHENDIYDRELDDGLDDEGSGPSYNQMLWQIPAAVAGFAFVCYFMASAMIEQDKQRPKPEPQTLELNKQ